MYICVYIIGVLIVHKCSHNVLLNLFMLVGHGWTFIVTWYTGSSSWPFQLIVLVFLLSWWEGALHHETKTWTPGGNGPVNVG